MTTHAETIAGHAVWSTADRAKEALDEAYPDSEAVRDVLARVRYLLDKVDDRGGGEEYHYSSTSLDQVNTHLSNLTSSLAQMAGNEAYAPHVHAEIDAALTSMSSWPPAKSPRLTQAVRDASGEHISQLEKQAAQASKVIADNETATQTALKKVVAQHEDLTKQYEDLLTGIRSAQTATSDAIEKLDDKYDAAKETWDDAAKSQRESLASDNSEHRKQWTDDARAEFEKIEGIAHEAGLVAEAVAEKQIAEHYREYAQEQRAAANWWNIITVVVLVALTGVLMWALTDINTVAWHASVLRFGISLSVLGVAGYCGSQANGHRREERKARRIQHGLSSVGAFMSTVDEERRSIVRSVVATQLFEDDGSKDGPSDGNWTHQTTQLLAGTRGRVSPDKTAAAPDPSAVEE